MRVQKKKKGLAPGLERPHSLQSVASGGTLSDVLGKETSSAVLHYRLSIVPIDRHDVHAFTDSTRSKSTVTNDDNGKRSGSQKVGGRGRGTNNYARNSEKFMGDIA